MFPGCDRLHGGLRVEFAKNEMGRPSRRRPMAFAAPASASASAYGSSAYSYNDIYQQYQQYYALQAQQQQQQQTAQSYPPYNAPTS